LDHSISARYGNFEKQTGEVYSFFNPIDGEAQETYPHAFNFLDLNYSLSKSFLNKGKWKLGGGGRERNRLQVVDYAYGTADFFS
jgi:hypothetical protein